MVKEFINTSISVGKEIKAFIPQNLKVLLSTAQSMLIRFQLLNI